MPRENYCSGAHILVGLGGTGGRILRAFKMRMFEEYPTQDERRQLPVSLLYVDSTDEMMPKDGRARVDFRVMGMDASFAFNEFLNIKAVDVEHILDHINNYPAMKGIVDDVETVKKAIGYIGAAAGGKRRAGRLLFAANAVHYVNCLRHAVYKTEAVTDCCRHTNIYIFTGLAGATGSSAIIDAIVQARKTFPNARIYVFAMMPGADLCDGVCRQNCYAALNELNALQTGRWNPQDVTGLGESDVYSERVQGVADVLTVFGDTNEYGYRVDALTEMPKIVADYMFARIFDINEWDMANRDIIRAFEFKSMATYAVEQDEMANPDSRGYIPAVRTKKLNAFGIKRVICPEQRVLKHMTYTVGKSVLYQFMYNNWQESRGFVSMERGVGYYIGYLDEYNLSTWMLDEKHLTLEEKILESDRDYPCFIEYWRDKAIAYAKEAKKADCPLNELDNIMGGFYNCRFRECGVEEFYASKAKAIPEMAREVRRIIERDLLDKWMLGDVSITELQNVSCLLLNRIVEIRAGLEAKTEEERACYEEYDAARAENVNTWSRMNIFQRLINKNARLYAEHQKILTDYYTSRTKLVAYGFAQQLAAYVQLELGRMNADISAFSRKINDAIAETEKLITAHRKVNKGLEDMRGAIIEVSDDEAMTEFEEKLKTDEVKMSNISYRMRDAILPKTDFVNFGTLTNDISIDDIKDAFDIMLSSFVKQIHDDKADADNKVLGLNILTQLQQKLRTDDDIKAFASQIVQQSSVYLRLNQDQMHLHLRNNEGSLSPTNPASINLRTILVTIPSPDGNESQRCFADKLEEAFRNSLNRVMGRTFISISRRGMRKDELSLMTVAYCFPIRAIEGMEGYKECYEQFLNSGDPVVNKLRATQLHTEGDGSHYPPLLVVDNAEDIFPPPIPLSPPPPPTI